MRAKQESPAENSDPTKAAIEKEVDRRVGKSSTLLIAYIILALGWVYVSVILLNLNVWVVSIVLAALVIVLA
jgi:fatty acid desaturase